MNPTGDPGKRPVIMSQPSSLEICASYHATGPLQGWWLFTIKRVYPSALLFGATAMTLLASICIGSFSSSGPRPISVGGSAARINFLKTPPIP